MDSDQPPSAGRKVKFAPKAPTRRQPKASVQPKKRESDDAAEAKQLLQHLSDLKTFRRQRPRAESKPTVQAAFIHGPNQSSGSSIPQGGNRKQSNGSEFKKEGDDHKRSEVPSSSVMEESSPETEYREPWDYAHTYYPMSLPLRKPYSGDPGILDEAEFGEAARRLEYDERVINPASELGFLDLDKETENARLLFFKLPQSLPAIRRSASAREKEKEGTSALPDQRGSVASSAGGRGSSIRPGTLQRSRGLEALSAGKMGKLLVYKSGAVKLKLGDVLYDVSPGSDCASAQEVVAINTQEKGCCAVGELHKHAVVTPDIEYLLSSAVDLD